MRPGPRCLHALTLADILPSVGVDIMTHSSSPITFLSTCLSFQWTMQARIQFHLFDRPLVLFTLARERLLVSHKYIQIIIR
jgi:hypothetical protein